MGRQTVLLVEDDPGTLHVMRDGLENVLDDVDVVAASNGREAIEVLESRTVDVLVTDLSMPVLDGFSLIAAVTNRYASMPVVVLSGMAQADVDPHLSRYRGLRLLRKPTSYHAVASAVSEALERVELGQIEGIPLAAVLQLVAAERRSCTLHITSGRRKGRLDFQSGILVNAYSDDFGVDGEAAAHDILGWSDTQIDFDHLGDDVRRTIHTPMQLMMIEVAVSQDGIDGAGVSGGVSASEARPSAHHKGTPFRHQPVPVAPSAIAARIARPNQEEPMSHHPDHTPPSADGWFQDDEERSAAALEGVPDVSRAAPQGVNGDPVAHATNLVTAMERLAQRVTEADDALAAVAAEVALFRDAQRSFDAVESARERRRLELEAFRVEVSRLAHEILGRVDGLFAPQEAPGAPSSFVATADEDAQTT
jgi:CheY-like chemotaxis protein